MMLRDSEFKGNSSYHDLLARVQGILGNDPFGYRRELCSLIGQAELLSR
jgi:hypothetical protein